MYDQDIQSPADGTSIMLKGDIDEQGNPNVGSVAVLLYPTNISEDQSKTIKVNWINCITPQDYGPVAEDQVVLASYDIDVTDNNLIYFCMNYEEEFVDKETVTVYLFDELWKALPENKTVHIPERNMICADISGQTPYMIAGFAAAEPVRPEIEDKEIEEISLDYGLMTVLLVVIIAVILLVVGLRYIK
jgi:hypothetical protein